MPSPDLNIINNANLSGLAQPVQVIAVTGGKGGVGKTSVSVNLATALAATGHRTLLIDLDPQGNASTGLGVSPRDRNQPDPTRWLPSVSLLPCR